MPAVDDASTERDRAHAAAGTAWLPDVIKNHLGSRDVARLIYGATIGLAEAYAEFVGEEARLRRRPSRTQVVVMLEDAGAVVAGAGFPAVFFVLALAGVIELDTAFDLAKWTGLTLICAYGFVAARLAGSGRLGALLHAAAVGAIGGILIALKAVLH